MEVTRQKKNSLKSGKSLFFGVSVLFLTLITGCASTRIRQSLHPEHGNTTPFIVISEAFTDADEAADSIAQTESQTIEAMFAQAEYFCASESYPQADSLLKEIIALIKYYDQSSNQVLKNDEKDELLSNVVGMYADLMPPEYLTDEISLFIGQKKLLESIDSIVISDSDTILPAILKSLAETKYDVPIAFNERVQKSCMFFLRNNRGTVKKWLERSAVYLPTMQKMFADSGLPLDLVYLPLIESGFNPRAYSRAHASGIWQFIPSTGKIYGLRSNYWLDERRDPLKATVSAIRYLKKLYRDFGDWHLALAAYNCGEGGVGRAIKKAGVADYWQLKLPRETMNYVPLYLASLIIIKNVERFGFSTPESSTILNFDTVTINDCIDMNEIALGIGVHKDTLRLMNPHILHWCTPPDMTNIRLYVPEGVSESFQQFYSNIPDQKKVKWYRYKIASGDNLLLIAKKFKIPVEAIKTVNRMKSNSIIAGHSLFIPIPVHQTMPRIAETIATTENKTRKPTRVPTETETRYKVKKGDTLWGIAELFGVKVEDICDWNGFSAGKTIKDNDIIVVYKSTAAPQPDKRTLVDYKVSKGDTPYSIAKKFNMTINDLVDINELDKMRPTLIAGSSVKVHKATAGNLLSAKKMGTKPADNNATRYRVQKGDNLFRIAENFDISVAAIQSLNDLTARSVIKAGDILLLPVQQVSSTVASAPFDQDVLLYEVKRGDNLWSIAVNFGISVQQLYTINNLTPESVLMPGDVIKVSKAKNL